MIHSCSREGAVTASPLPHSVYDSWIHFAVWLTMVAGGLCYRRARFDDGTVLESLVCSDLSVEAGGCGRLVTLGVGPT